MENAKSRSRTPPPIDNNPPLKRMRHVTYNNTSSNSRIFIPPISSNVPLYTFKTFMLKQDDEINADEARIEYNKYYQKYIKNFYEQFFDENKNLGYIIEQYHPNTVAIQFDKQCLRCKFNAKLFKEMIRDDTLNGLRWSVDIETNRISHEISIKSKKWISHKKYILENLDIISPPHFFQNPLQNCLQIDQINQQITKWDIADALKELAGFVDVFISDNLEGFRTAWCCFLNFNYKMSAYENLTNDKIIIKEFLITVSLPKLINKFEIGITPPIMSIPERIEEDINTSFKLINKFDKAFNVAVTDDPILDNICSTSTYFETIMNPIERLDLQIYYLRKVHNVCYYTSQHFNDELDGWKKPIIYFLRTNFEIKKNININEASNEQINWMKNLDEKLQNLLNKEIIQPIKLNLSHPIIKEKWKASCEERTIKDNEKIYRCNICNKGFKSPPYVHLHMDRAHLNYLDPIIDSVAIKIMKDNYLSDKHHPGPEIEILKENPYKIVNKQDYPIPRNYMAEQNYYDQKYRNTSYSNSPYSRFPPYYPNNQHMQYTDRQTGNAFHNNKQTNRKTFKDYDNPNAQTNEAKTEYSRPIITYDDL